MTPDSHIVDITRLIQLAVAPVFMLTAVGTLLGVLSNRLGRAVDRRRYILEHGVSLTPDALVLAQAELPLLAQRIRLIYIAMAFAVFSALFVGLLIAVAFLDAFVSIDLTRFVGALFVAAMLAFIASLIVFLREIFVAVSRLRDAQREVR